MHLRHKAHLADCGGACQSAHPPCLPVWHCFQQGRLTVPWTRRNASIGGVPSQQRSPRAHILCQCLDQPQQGAEPKRQGGLLAADAFAKCKGQTLQLVMMLCQPAYPPCLYAAALDRAVLTPP